MARGFVLDLKRCIGCKACVAVCKVRYDLPEGVTRRRVYTRETKDNYLFVSMACNHCENPACLRACPKGAITKDAQGRVIHNKDLCVGCRRCEWACPYGAVCYDPTTKKVDKCDGCATKADGPRCAEACHAKALQWVETTDPAFAGDAEISIVTPADETVAVLPKAGLTNPNARFKKFNTNPPSGPSSIV